MRRPVNGDKANTQVTIERRRKPRRPVNGPQSGALDFRALVENSADTIVLLDGMGAIQWASPSIGRDMDYSLDDEFLGHGAFEFLHPDDVSRLMSSFARLLAEPGGTLMDEFRARRKDGTWRWIEGRATNLLHDETVGAIVCNYRDISDRKVAEEALRKSEERFRAMLENSTEMIALMEADGTVVWGSPSITKHFGYSLTESTVSENAVEFVHPEDRDRFLSEFGAIIGEAGATGSINVRARHVDGSWRWVEAVAKNLLHEPSVAAVVFNIRDITDRKAAEDALTQSANYHRTLLENAPDLTTVIDYTGVIRSESPSVERMLGYAPVELEGVSIFNLVHPDDVARVTATIAAAVRNLGTPQHVQYRIQHKDGSWRHLEAAGKVVLDETGAPFGVINSRDVTERVVAEEAVLAEKGYSEAVIRSLPGVFYLFDVTGKFFKWNRNMETISGYSGHEIAQMQPLDFIAEEDRLMVADRIREVFQNGESSVEARFRTKEGEKIPYFFTGLRLSLEGKDCLCGLGINIAERMAAEDALRESEEKFRTITENSSDLITILDPGGTIRYQSPSLEKMLGHTTEERAGRNIFENIHPEDVDKIRETIARAAASPGTSVGVRYRGRHTDGSWRYLEAIGKALVDDNGEIYGITSTRDITDRVVAEESLRASEERTRFILQTSLDAIITIRSDGVVNSWNPQAEAIFGWRSEDVIGRPLVEMIIPERYREQHRLGLERWRSTGEGPLLNRRIEIEALHRDGHEFMVELTIAPFNDNGETSFSAFVRDVTERVRAKEELQQNAAELEQRVAERTAELQRSNDDLQAFASSISHDLRAPLLTMKSYGEALLEDYSETMDHAERAFTSRVVQTTADLDTLIQDILGYSQIGAARMVHEKVDLGAMIALALNQLTAQIGESKARVTVPPSVHRVYGHPQILLQAVVNLVSNAIKFVAAGTEPKVTIRTSARGDSIRLWVEDNGIGIPEESRERVFDIFKRLHGIEAYPGSGIGLAIVKRGVERLGGSVGVESGAGKGSRFWIDLPSAQAKRSRAGRKVRAGKPRKAGR